MDVQGVRIPSVEGFCVVYDLEQQSMLGALTMNVTNRTSKRSSDTIQGLRTHTQHTQVLVMCNNKYRCR